MSDLFRNQIISSSKIMPPKSQSKLKSQQKFDPISWNEYYDYKEDLETDVGTFRIYRRGLEGPLLFFLHGGGFSALSWALLCKAITSEVQCQCLAMDIRGHGDTITKEEEDLSADVLAKDVERIIMTMFPSEAPPIILIGHSMGGAIAVHSAVQNRVPSLVGLVVIDVVEGSALEALYSMNSLLQSRPKQFKSMQAAIEWSVKSGQIRNVESARVSFPGQLKHIETNEPATHFIDCATPNTDQSGQLINNGPNQSKALVNPTSSDHNQQSDNFTWRIDLSRTEKFWKGWFQGMSQMFLSVVQPKLLLLAGIDRMDKELTIGQMQGKFQMHIIPQSGHTVHEDFPDKVADCLASFLVRNRFTEAKKSFEKPMPCC